jgi:FKBP-type peptidyl-prolyl cis-trans isomerase FkpA
MIRRIIPVTLLGVTLAFMSACNSGSGFKTTKDGLEYRIVKDSAGSQHPAVGDLVEMHIVTRVGDSVLFDSRKLNNDQPVQFPLNPPAFKGDMSEGFALLTPGDSAVFRISLDSIRKTGAQLLPWMKPTDKLQYEVVLLSVKSQQEVQQEREQQAAAQKETDDQLLQEYFAQQNLKPAKTESGLYYLIEKEGKGATAQPGQQVTVNYTGRTLKGVVFDSNVDPQFNHVEPFRFPLGQGAVIPGWDEGISLLKKGSKARLFIPSPLAYGPQSPSPDIPENSILIFDVEVTEIQ